MESLPKFYDTFIPILQVLSDGKVLHYSDLKKQVFEAFFSSLPNELLQMSTKDGEPLILNRIGWGKAYLKQAGMVHQPQRAMVQITEKGKKVLKKGSLTLEELKKDDEYQQHELAKSSHNQNDATVDNSDQSPQDLIDAGVDAIEKQVVADLLERLKTVDPYYFERIVLDLFHKMGYGDFSETAKSGDMGIDGIINQDELGLDKIYVQAKRYNGHNVRETDIRNFIGAMSGDTLKGIFVTTSEFDKGAITKAQAAHHKIILIDGKTLANLMLKFGIGVQVKSTYNINEIDEDYFS